jgi:hypothetical protein
MCKPARRGGLANQRVTRESAASGTNRGPHCRFRCAGGDTFSTSFDRDAGGQARGAELFGLSIVSAITLLVSIWISFVLPQQVVRPLMSLKEAVDHAAAGNYEIEF